MERRSCSGWLHTRRGTRASQSEIRTTENVLMNEQEVYSTENIKRLAEGSEYDAECMEWAKAPIDEQGSK